MEPSYAKEYPKLDSRDQGYAYNEPPASHPVSRELNSNDLQENLLQPKAEVKKADPNMYPFLAVSALMAIEMVYFFYILPGLANFEYCYWDFGIKEYNAINTFPMVDIEEGSTSYFYNHIECEKNVYPECPGLCNVAVDFKSGRPWFYYGLIGKYALGCIGYFSMAFAARKNYLKYSRLIFITTEVISFLSLIIGTICYFNIIDLDRLGKPTIGYFEVQPRDLAYKNELYLGAALIFFLFACRGVISVFIKNTN